MSSTYEFFTIFIGCVLDYAIVYFPSYNIKTENKIGFK